jgi:hypothetical protein
MTTHSFLAFFSAALLTTTLGGMPPATLSLTPAQQAVHDAASIKDPGERERALEKAIAAGLSPPDPDASYQVYVYLADNARWIDLRPFASLLIQFGRTHLLGHRALRTLDEAELMRAPRHQREDACRMAIMDGKTLLPHGASLIRKVAILFACDDGLDSLAPLIRDYLMTEYPQEHAKLLAALELGAGAEDREDAIRLSAQRLRGMDAAALYERMDADADFRSVVTRVTEDGCASNPFLGGVNRGCADMKIVVGRLSAHEAELKKKTPAVGPLDAKVASFPPKETWLGRLRHAAH